MIRHKQSGFTLIELLVVIFIISIVSGVALLSIGRNQNGKIQAFSKQLTETLTLAEQQAMLQPMVIGVSVNEGHIQFYRFQSQVEGQAATWVELQDKLLNRLTIPEGIRLALASSQNKSATDDQEEEAAVSPQIVISTNGDITPFTLYLGQGDNKPRFAIQGDADGAITQQNLS